MDSTNVQNGRKTISSKRTTSPKNKNVLVRIRTTKSTSWSRVQRESALQLFSLASKKLPAYQNFLKKNRIHSQKIKNYEDFTTLPYITKKNYLHSSDHAKLFWQGSLRNPHVITSTSGSTGKPTYFARSQEVDDHSALIHELIFTNSSLKVSSSTLVIVCFGMGVWIGGLITYQAFEKMSRKGYPISILTPGINKAEILKALTDLAPHYEQIVLAGYPPFLKDIVDEAAESGISFAKQTVMLLFAAEAFTENFRDVVAKKANIKNVLTNTVNIYGSADLGTMAFETPLSILIRRLALKNPKLFAELFNGTTKTPTLAQYIPNVVSFEAPNGEILLTGDSAMPLIRYSIGDHGGVFTYNEIVDLCKKHGIKIQDEVKKAGIQKAHLELPFVYVYERIDLATTLYGLQIYPETIKEVLLQESFQAHCTGKLSLITKYDENQDQYLEVNIELKRGKEMSSVEQSKLTSEMVKNLREKNSEFHELSNFLGSRSVPKLVFWPYEDPLYFKPGIKQAWVIRPS